MKFDRSWFSILGVIATVLFSLSFAHAQEAKTEAKEKDKSQTKSDSKTGGEKDFDLEANLESFDKVWSTIDRVHWDQEKVGQDWDEARTKFRPMVEKATSSAEVRQALNEMIETLGQSHFGIIPSSSYDVVNEKKGGGDGTAGMDFRVTDDGILVSHVRPGSSAEEAGVVAGWILEAVDDKPAEKLTGKLKKAAHGPTRFETLVGLAIPRIAGGKVGETKQFVFRDGQNETKELELKLQPKPGKKTKFGHLPAMHVDSESRTLNGNVGYYRFNAFLDPARIMKEYRETIRDEKHSGGVVIDLRGNIGGLGGMTMGMASEFSDKETSLGVMTTKGSQLKFFVNENYDPVQTHVAVLIDECSISSAEIFSGGLKDLGLAKLFGNRTAGLALPSMIEKLPNGDGFQYAFADYQSASGKSLEMDGVAPDVDIPLSRALLLSEPDPVLNRALEWIQSQKK